MTTAATEPTPAGTSTPATGSNVKANLTVQKTEYHVLAQTTTGGTPTYELFAKNVAAANAEQAIRQAHAKTPADTEQPTTTYIAVPSRSWRPVKVTTETKKIVTLEAT